MCQMWWCDVQWCDIRGWMQMVLTQYDLFSWNKRSINFNIVNITSNYIVTKKFSWRCSLCARWLLFIAPDPSFLLLPAPCCLHPCLELTAYLPPCLGDPALPHPLPLSWPHFPQGKKRSLCKIKMILPLQLIFYMSGDYSYLQSR